MGIKQFKVNDIIMTPILRHQHCVVGRFGIKSSDRSSIIMTFIVYLIRC